MAKVIDGVIYLRQGDTEELRISVENEQGAAIPFQAGDVVTFTVRETAAASAVRMQAQETVTAETAGNVFTLRISADKTRQCGYGEFTGDIQVAYVNGEIKTVFPKLSADKRLVTDTNWKNVHVTAEVTR